MSWEPVDIDPTDRDGIERKMISGMMATLLKLRQNSEN